MLNDEVLDVRVMPQVVELKKISGRWIHSGNCLFHIPPAFCAVAMAVARKVSVWPSTGTML